MAVLAIDFDSVVHDPRNVPPGYKMGQPMPGAVAALRGFQEAGHVVIIHTVRATNMAATKAVMDWLNYFGLPFTRVTSTKPQADVYIDDKAIRFTDWDRTLAELDGLLKGR